MSMADIKWSNRNKLAYQEQCDDWKSSIYLALCRAYGYSNCLNLLVHQYADQSSTQCPPFSSFEDHFNAYPTFTIITVDDSFISNKNQIAWGVVVWKPYSSPIMDFAASSYGLTAEHSELEAIYHSEMSTDRALIPTDSKLLVNAFQ